MITSSKLLVRRIGLSVLLGLVLMLPYLMGAIPAAGFFTAYPMLCLIVSLVHVLLPTKVRQNVMLACVSAVLTLCLLDVVMRSPIFFPHMIGGRWPPLPVLYRWPANVSRQYTKWGNLSHMLGDLQYGEVSEREVITDAYGFRNRESDPAGVEIITLGDSYTIGAVSQDDAWTVILSEQLDQKVYNLGVTGSSPWQQYVTFSLEQPRLRTVPDAAIIWMIFTGNDLDESYYPEWDIENLNWSGIVGYPMAHYRNFQDASRVGIVLTRIVTDSAEQVMAAHMPAGEPILFYEPELRNAQIAVEAVREHHNFEALAITIREMRDLAAERGFRLYMVIAPSKPEIYRWVWDEDYEAGSAPVSAISEVVAETARKDGVCVLELAPLYAAEAVRLYEEEGEQLWWQDATHWNVRGNQFAADSIAEWLQSGACQ